MGAAYQALASLASLSRRSAAGLPAQEDVAPRWSGIGFGCLGQKYVVPMGQIKEMMEVPQATTLPGVQPWVIGLSNVRGRLLPLFDLARFVNSHLNSQKKSHRVLVLETDTLYSGLVVDQAFGMQHFIIESFKAPSASENRSGLARYVKGSYTDDGGDRWNVFDVNELAIDPRFISAAAV